MKKELDKDEKDVNMAPNIFNEDAVYCPYFRHLSFFSLSDENYSQ